MNLSLSCLRLCVLVAFQRKKNDIIVPYRYLIQYNLSNVTLKIAPCIILEMSSNRGFLLEI